MDDLKLRAEIAANQWIERQKYMSDLMITPETENAYRYVFKLGFLSGVENEIKRTLIKRGLIKENEEIT